VGNLSRLALRFAAAVVGVLVAASLLLVALSEFGEVVVIHTALEDGTERRTRIWIVDTEEGPLVRGTAGKPWVDGIRRRSAVEVDRAGERRAWVAVEPEDPSTCRLADRLMREKYGVADRAIALLRDYESSTCFRLRPAGS
jgi:hypothetical protein